jgi:hypothetical protein
VAKIRTYCLCQNRYDFLIEILSEEELLPYFSSRYIYDNVVERLEELTSRQFGSFLNCYAKSFNNQQGRTGSLFMKPFKRRQLHSRETVLGIIKEMHCHPVRKGLCEEPGHWKYSSYREILSGELDSNGEYILRLFGSAEEFIKFHS